MIIESHSLAESVEDIGCQVRIASSGESSLEAAASHEFDLVLLDVMLPGIDSLEVCRRLRARQQYMPGLMLTARSSEIDKLLGLETGADDYLTNPFSVQELLATHAGRRAGDRSIRTAGRAGPCRRDGHRPGIDTRGGEAGVRSLLPRRSGALVHQSCATRATG
jgi:DNA-binding response OmpR family regulator